MTAGRVLTAEQLGALADRLGVRPDWHGPDEQEVTASVYGTHLDNAGFWGETGPAREPHEELWVRICRDGEPVAEVNLASLLAWASAPHRA